MMHDFNPKSTNRLLPHCVIGQYYYMSFYLANYDTDLKMWSHKLVHETMFVLHSLGLV